MERQSTEIYGTTATNEKRNGHLSRDAPGNQPAGHIRGRRRPLPVHRESPVPQDL